MAALARAAMLAMLLATSACAPDLNWREVRPAQADGLKALFPCKPDAHERQVPWPGLPQGLLMRMLSCRTEEGTWALSYVTVPEVGLIVPSLHEMTMTMRRNLGAASRMASQASSGGMAPATGFAEHDMGPAVVPHMTPMPQAHAWRFTAQRPDAQGHPVEMAVQAWHFSHGMTVFQASVWRPASAVKSQSSEDVAQAFFGGLQFPG